MPKVEQVAQTTSSNTLPQYPWSTFLVDPESGTTISSLTQVDKASYASSDGTLYPVIGGIARFCPNDDFADSFGFQWNAFEVADESEDRETFTVKTGTAPGELVDKVVLDAGCGGGRYTKEALRRGAWVFAVDRSRAVEKAYELVGDRSRAEFFQADLTALPIKTPIFDVVFSIGVLHHSPNAHASFQAIANLVKPGGRLTVWLYRKNIWWQEMINSSLRELARRASRRTLLLVAKVLAVLGGIPFLNRTLNKIVNFSNHPKREVRICDNFDWYSPTYQSHHTFAEVKAWFEAEGFSEIRELAPEKTGRIYRWAFRNNLIIGSGVNVTGVKRD